MSAYKFYKEQAAQRRTPTLRTISNAAVAGTMTIATPTSGAKLVVTNLVIGSNPGGTIAFYFGGNYDNDSKIAMYQIGASSHLAPAIEAWEIPIADAPLEAMVSTGLTDAWTVNVEGFDLYDN